MKIFDCIIFNNENLLTKIRLNTLNNYVDYFVICESGEDHMGRKKYFKFNIDSVEKFRNKIIYLKFLKIYQVGKDKITKEIFC